MFLAQSDDMKAPGISSLTLMPALKPRVWLVDDSPVALASSASILEPAYQVERFSDGSAVLERAATGQLPDVLVLDWIMPGVSGLEVLLFLRASARTVGLPIVVLTATANEADLTEAFEAGADDYVAKPCRAGELVLRVRSLIRSKAMRERAESAEHDLAESLVSERAARAEAESASQVKDDFLATLSHELRTPLNAIVGWIGLVRTGKLSPAALVRANETIERNALAQASIIDGLLDVSRIVSGKLRLEMLATDVGEATEQALETLRAGAEAKGVALHTHIERVGLISGDAARIQQMVRSLVSNAIQFTPSGGAVTVDVEVLGADVRIRVTDTGEGISAEQLPRIFDRFMQGDPSRTRAHGGLGLGLTIVRHLAELHGGTARARSEGLGHGSTFEVSLPLASPHAPKSSPSTRPSMIPMPLVGLKVLIAEDDPDSRELLVSVLSQAGAVVTAVPCALDALLALDRQSFDVLVSDIMMPGIDGYSLIRTIRARTLENGGSIPAIALSAATRETDRTRALTAGFNLHMSKPIDVDGVIHEIARLARRA